MLLISLTSFAQGKQDNRGGRQQFDPQKFEQQLEQFVVKEAGFNQSEAAKFLPIFREMRKKYIAIMAKKGQQMKNIPKNDAECAEAIKNYDNSEVQLKKIEETYHQKMVRVVPASKVLKACFAEERFHREAFRMVQNMNKGGHGRGNHHGGMPGGKR